MKKKVFVADSESLTGDITETRVWAWGITTLYGGDRDFYCTNKFDKLLKYVDDGELTEKVVYFHNLKHDGSFILQYLLHNKKYQQILPPARDGSYHVKSNLMKDTFQVIIDEYNTFYAIKICLDVKGNNRNIITFYDSYKLISYSIADISKYFNLEMTKGDLDYEKYRDINHKITDEELDYIKRDVFILRDALKIFFKHTFENPHITISSCAYSIWFEMFKSSFFKEDLNGNLYCNIVNEFGEKINYTPNSILPTLDDSIYNTCRDSYRGGFVYVNPKHQNKLIDDIVYKYDINSSFPNVMMNCSLPIGKPRELSKDELDTCYFNDRGMLCYTDKRLNRSVETIYYIGVLKDFRGFWKCRDNCVPCFPKPTLSDIQTTEYIDQIVSIRNTPTKSRTFTGVDLQTFYTNYEYTGGYTFDYDNGTHDFVEFECVYVFNSSRDIFKSYINYWIDVKNKATEDNDTALRTIAKIMLNSVYGKFGINPNRKNKYVALGLDNELIFKNIYVTDECGQIITDECGRPIKRVDKAKQGYIPIASFITAFARQNLIFSINSNMSDFIYCDTDSMHLLSKAKNIELHKTKLGAWKDEGCSTKSKYLRTKCYIHKVDDVKIVTVAGLPKYLHDKVDFDNFVDGLTIYGKLVPKQINGGVVLYKTEYTLKV